MGLSEHELVVGCVLVVSDDIFERDQNIAASESRQHSPPGGDLSS